LRRDDERGKGGKVGNNQRRMERREPGGQNGERWRREGQMGRARGVGNGKGLMVGEKEG
jgi:hypothetical protein